MRILFSSTPAHGHLLPLLPLARAFRARGNDVAVLTSGGIHPVLAGEGFELLAAGPLPDVMFAEVARRTGQDAAAAPTPEVVAEFFAGVRLDLTADAALAAAGGRQPDLVVSELCDFVGPLVAAELDVPVAKLAYGPALPPEFTGAMDALAALRYAERGLAPRPASWYLDTCAPLMQVPGWEPPAERLGLRPEPHRSAGTGTPEPALEAQNTGRPRVLVTFGTHFSSPEVLSPLLKRLSEMDIDLTVTLGFTAHVEDFDVAPGRVRFAAFTPLEELLGGIDLVVTHGGAGTTFAALSRGIPLVVIPQGADQFVQADRVAAAGAGIALPPGSGTPDAVAEAAAEILGDPAVRTAAISVGKEIAALPCADAVAATLETALRQ
jgi:UDP:flavonoid glycosyltransferase YjiC (YdhE family)